MNKPGQIEWACQHCGAAQVSVIDETLPEGDVLTCEDCGKDWEIRPGAEHVVDGRVERCRFCDSSKLYVQKSFNRAVGVGSVVVGAVAAILLGIYVHPFLFGAVLVAFIVLDAVLYRFLPLVDVCYRCQSVYHGFEPVEGREGFDLDLAEWNERQYTLEVEHRLAGLDRTPDKEGQGEGS